MKGFPECLQADICLHLNANLLCTMKVFQSARLGCLRAFALRLTTTHLPPGDYIVYQGDEVNHLFFIIRGTVEVVRDDVIMAILGETCQLYTSPILTRVEMDCKVFKIMNVLQKDFVS